MMPYNLKVTGFLHNINRIERGLQVFHKSMREDGCATVTKATLKAGHRRIKNSWGPIKFSTCILIKDLRLNQQ